MDTPKSFKAFLVAAIAAYLTKDEPTKAGLEGKAKSFFSKFAPTWSINLQVNKAALEILKEKMKGVAETVKVNASEVKLAKLQLVLAESNLENAIECARVHFGEELAQSLVDNKPCVFASTTDMLVSLDPESVMANDFQVLKDTRIASKELAAYATAKAKVDSVTKPLDSDPKYAELKGKVEMVEAVIKKLEMLVAVAKEYGFADDGGDKPKDNGPGTAGKTGG